MAIDLIEEFHTVRPRQTTQNTETGEVMCNGAPLSYQVIRSKKRKRSISLSLRDSTCLNILVPVRTSMEFIQSLLEKRQKWIAQTHARQQEKQSVERYHDGMEIPYRGDTLKIHVTFDAMEKRGCTLRENTLFVNMRFENLSPPALEAQLRAQILKWFQKTALDILQERLDRWAQIMGVRFKNLKLNNARRLWGSCAHDNAIRINWRIIMTPDDVMDYLLVHELSHIIHKNHSRRFWAMVSRTLPDFEVRRKTLRHDYSYVLGLFRK